MVLKLVNSKGGIIGIAIIALLGAFLWHKASIGWLEIKVNRLENKVEQTEGRVKKQANLKDACEFNLSGVKANLEIQNQKVESLKTQYDKEIEAATVAALASITSDDRIAELVSGPQGAEEMNMFMIDIFGRM